MTQPNFTFELIAQSQDVRAIEVLDPVIAARAAAPYGALALAHFTAARAFEHLGARDRAADAMTAAIAAAPDDDPRAIRSRARTALARLRSHRD